MNEHDRVVLGEYNSKYFRCINRMMINHSTLDCHVTFSTRSQAVPERLFETLTLLSDPNPNPNPIPNKNIY